MAWCWNDGWLQNLGYIDYGGVAIVHVMGGLAGYMGTLIIGPRIGLFENDKKLSYLLDEDKFLEEKSNKMFREIQEHRHVEGEDHKSEKSDGSDKSVSPGP